MVFSYGHPTYQCKSGQFKIRDYMDRRVTSPTWGPPLPCKQALKKDEITEKRKSLSCTCLLRPSAQSICMSTPIKRSLDKGIVNRLTKSLWFGTPAGIGEAEKLRAYGFTDATIGQLRLYFSERTKSVRIGTETCSEWKEMFRTFQRKDKTSIGPLLSNVFDPGFPELPGLKYWQKQLDQNVHKWQPNVCCRWKDGRGGKDSINGRGKGNLKFVLT